MIPKEVASSSSNQLSESEYSINRRCSARKKKEEEGVRIDASSLHGEEREGGNIYVVRAREDLFCQDRGRRSLFSRCEDTFLKRTEEKRAVFSNHSIFLLSAVHFSLQISLGERVKQLIFIPIKI